MEICADCGKPIGMSEGSYYKKAGDNSDIGQTFHSLCGDPFGLKSKDAEIAQLKQTLCEIANRAGNFMDDDAADWMPSIYKLACEAIGEDAWPLLKAGGHTPETLLVSMTTTPLES